jgi:hypothetical protein
MQVFSLQFLDSRVNFDTINGLEIVTLPAPTTKEGIKNLLKELRDYVLQTSSPHITRDVDLRSKNKMIQCSETELSRLGIAFRGLPGYVLRRILVNEEGVRLVDGMVSSGSYEQDSEVLATRTSPILAKDWRDILLKGLQPYLQNVNTDICEDTPSDSRATNDMNPLTMFPTEQSIHAEESMETDGVELIEEDISALRKYRSWITGEGEYCQAIQNSSEVPRRSAGFTLLGKDNHLEKKKTPSQTRKIRFRKKRPAKDAVPLFTEGIQTIEEFIHDATSRKFLKRKGFEDDSR